MLSSIASAHGQQTPPKMKLEENYKYRLARSTVFHSKTDLLTLAILPAFRLYKLVSYMASLLYRKWISSSDSKTFMASCSDQNGINVASRYDRYKSFRAIQLDIGAFIACLIFVQSLYFDGWCATQLSERYDFFVMLYWRPPL